MDAAISYTADGFIARIGLDRPARHNALTPRTLRRLAEVWQEVALDRGVRVAILYGNGPSFCSGLDIGETHPGFGYRPKALAALDDAERAAAARYEALPGEKRRLNYVPPPNLGKPVVCALHGRVSGGGLELALACDIRIAADDAVFALPEVTRGIVPASGAMYWLPRIVGLGRAQEMLLTGEPVTAQEAFRIGLVNRLVARADLMDSCTAMADRIAANAPLAVQATRDSVVRMLGAGPSEGLEISENQSRVLKASADYEEGFAAFEERRTPVFHGR